MYKDKFVLSVLHGGSPVKETGPKYNREVAIPFDSEYKIRLKNKNDRSCTARVFVDGKKVSQMGDFIINSGGTVDLERYVDRSLSEGKKFKFVPLDHPDVDDPTSSENGIIKVEFRLAKDPNGIKIKPFTFDWKITSDGTYRYKEDNDGIHWVYKPDIFTYTNSNFANGDRVTDTGNFCSTKDHSVRDTLNSVKCSARSLADPGATVEGGKSNQSFIYSDLEVEDNAVVLKLKLVGIRDREMIDRKYKYCSRCGNKVKRSDRYCSECGHRL